MGIHRYLDKNERDALGVVILNLWPVADFTAPPE